MWSKNYCIIVEDSPKGLEAAKLSGANVIQISTIEEVNINLFKDIT